jgi:DNA-binding GntR family transcriptional regulator
MYHARSLQATMADLLIESLEQNLIAQPWSSLAGIAYEAIVEGIVTGVLPAGSQVSIDGVSRQLKMSNTPVREALSRVAAERLIMLSANRGYTVAPRITEEDYHQLFEARRVLEIAAIKSAIINSKTTARVAKVMDQFLGTDSSPEYKHYRNFNRGDREFHLALVQMSRNRFLCHAWEQLHFHLHVGRLYAGAGIIDHQEACAEHEQIFAALQANDRKNALKRVGEHIEKAEQRLRQLLS